MSEHDERKLTRRRFLEHAAIGTAMTGAWYSIVMKTDALVRAQQSPAAKGDPSTGPSPYAYDEESS